MNKYTRLVMTLLLMFLLLTGCSVTEIMRNMANDFTPERDKGYLFAYGYETGVCGYIGTGRITFTREESNEHYEFTIYNSPDANELRYGPNFPKQVTPGTYYFTNIGYRDAVSGRLLSPTEPIYITKIEVEAGKLYYLGSYMTICTSQDMYKRTYELGHIRNNPSDIAEMQFKMPKFKFIPVVNPYEHLTDKNGDIVNPFQ